MSELEQLRLHHIPEGRRLLRDQHGNLLRVAEYCHGNYLQAGDKRQALEETMALSAQSLASVTYQVSSVAGAVLRLLELQAAQVRRLEADVTCLAQSVDIHQEKVSRRGIGALAVPRRVPSCHQVLAPPEPPVLEPYYRKPLNFSALDHVGHGVKVSGGPKMGPGWCFLGPRCVHSATPPWGHATSRPWGHPAPSDTGLVSPVPIGLGGGFQPPHPSLLTGGFAAPEDLELLPPPPDVPGCGDMALPPPPDVPGCGDRALSLSPAVPGCGDMALPPPPDVSGSPEEPPWGPESCLEKVVALYPYERQKADELSLSPGQLLWVTRRLPGGWCEGRRGRDSGIFPGNYVEPV
uniref:ABI family member 3 n=1 Tax=Cyanoderma ruficeps TaxID=181631 RepID=A0A8C3QIL3_9PASS